MSWLDRIPPSAVAICVFAIVVTDYLFQADMTAAMALMGGTLCLNILGFVMFDVVLYPYYYQWIARERGGRLTLAQVKDTDNTDPSRTSLNFCVEICGHLGLLLYTGGQFQLTSSYRQAMVTATLLYVIIVLPHIHHFAWEQRSWKLVATVEIYQWLRRMVAACALRFVSQLAGETLVGTVALDEQYDFDHAVLGHLYHDIVIPLLPVLALMTVLRFVLAFLWYGPFFSKYWIRAIRQYKHDKVYPSNAKINMPVLIISGIVCGIFQNILMLELQKLLGATENLETAIRSGFYLWFFYLLPSASTDLWEGKPLTLPMMEYSLHLVEICTLFALHAIFHNQ